MVDPDDLSAGGACQSTHMFMVVDLIGNPKINQTFIHDIESAFFVLLWMATHYVQAKLQTDHLSGLVNSVFHPQIFRSSGGPGNIMFMHGEEELDGLIFHDNAPLTQLLCTLKELLAVRHRKWPEAPHPYRLNINDVIHQALHEGAQGITSSSELSTANKLLQDKKGFQARLQEYNNCMSALSDHRVIISIITKAINNGDTPWPAIEPTKNKVLVLPIPRSWPYVQVPRDAGKQQWSAKALKAKVVNNVPSDTQEGSPTPAAVPSCPLTGQVQVQRTHSHVPLILWDSTTVQDWSSFLGEIYETQGIVRAPK
ncbi:hypothetical protein H4582DRAFT_2060874 [Lactarius indigo]|nr:hypothetical protein H4582DRAFT_2060874 [Lactarius indigo]